MDLTKPKAKVNEWTTNIRTRQGVDVSNKNGQSPPGPGEYTYQNETIQMKQIPNLNKTETMEDKRRGQLNFKNLSKKLTVEAGHEKEK